MRLDRLDVADLLVHHMDAASGDERIAVTVTEARAGP
jgi:hypothetical protein